MITIVGAGPAGSYLGHLLARRGKNVTILEEHSQIGSPVQCTGIVTHSIERFFRLKREVIAKRLDKVIVVSKNNRMTANVDEIVMWRDKFDMFVGEMARDAGAKILLNHQFTGFDGKNMIIAKDKKNNKTKKIKTDIIIGADGPYSAVAKAAGMGSNSRNYIGMQAKVKLKMDTTAFETHFGSDFPDFFGWAVPESEEVARIGIGCFKNARHYFYKFLEKRAGSRNTLCWESGLIPLYHPKRLIQKDNVYLIGDAAAQVKATTGGGIIPSLKAAHTLCDCIANNKSYSKEFKRHSGMELLLHLKIRNMLNRFSDKDYDGLLSLMDQEKVRRTLKKYDRDTPIPLMASLLIKEPRFLLFSKIIFARKQNSPITQIRRSALI
ncbi:NAD(P)/FAD-dependent oxidoreductase [Candidatus Woesearchaeota archaeon]|nr:NAD(P)/FAD-dependent oxidoreductase [Candidatus Woesearchaeota archaeon]